MSLEERLSHHGGREGHEDRNLKKMFSSFVLFVCFVGDIHVSFDCGSANSGVSGEDFFTRKPGRTTI